MTPKYEELPTDQLDLDLENPRFGLSDANDQIDALRILRNRANLKELIDSISEKGFQRFEPLVAIKGENGRYIVIEGNRRLAAVQLLLYPDRAAEVGMKSMPQISEQVASTIKALPVNLVDSRADAAEYIGFKHINGPSTWGSLAKAKFANNLYAQALIDVGKSGISALDLLSKRLGDGRQLLLRILVGYKVFEQARDNGYLYEEVSAQNTLDFSHLYTILQNPAARAYVGLGDVPLHEGQIRNAPVPEAYLGKLRNLIGWLFGTDKEPALIKRQGEDRPALARVLASTSATKILEDTRDFKHAIDEVGFDSEAWSANVSKLENLAKRIYEGAADLGDDYSIEDVERAVSRLVKAAKHIEFTKDNLESAYLKKERSDGA